MANNILLATFCKPFQVLSFCQKLWSQFPNEERLEKIFLLKIRDESQKVITYNITLHDDYHIDFKTILPKTVQIHRKKETKTLYTINAINAIQMKENGRIDPYFQIDWEKYKEQLLIERMNEIVCLDIELERIFYKSRKQ